MKMNIIQKEIRKFLLDFGGCYGYVRFFAAAGLSGSASSR